jgi:hypothetical protein
MFLFAGILSPSTINITSANKPDLRILRKSFKSVESGTCTPVGRTYTSLYDISQSLPPNIYILPLTRFAECLHLALGFDPSAFTLSH